MSLVSWEGHNPVNICEGDLYLLLHVSFPTALTSSSWSKPFMKPLWGMPKDSSATEALDLLGWDILEKRRRSHRLFLIFKSLNGLIDWNFNFNHFKDMHDYNTRFSNNFCKPQSKRLWGQHRLVCHEVDDWHALPDSIRNISDFLVFRRLIRNM